MGNEVQLIAENQAKFELLAAWPMRNDFFSFFFLVVNLVNALNESCISFKPLSKAEERKTFVKTILETINCLL